MKITTPFPDGEMNPILKLAGWQIKDIWEIREMLLREVKRQNGK